MPEEYIPRGSSAAEIAVAVEQAIRRGELAPGDRLPTIRRVAGEVGASHVTVAAAYRRLRDRGLVVGAGRAGTRVAAQPPLPVRRAPGVPPGVRDLADGNPDERLLPSLPPPAGGHVLYGAPAAAPELAGLLRASFEADGVRAEHLTVVSGALDGVERALTAHLRPGDAVAVEDPGFTRLLDLIPVLGFRRVPVAVDERGVRPDALERAIASGVAAVVLTPRAQNPSGAAFDGERAERLRAVLGRGGGVLVVEDDHAAGVAGAPYRSAAGGARHWAVVRSFGMALGPDLRVAGLAGDETTAARVEGRLLVGAGWVSHLLQRLVAAQLASPAAQQAVALAERAYTRRRQALVAALADEGVPAWGRSGLSVWVSVREEAATVQALLAAGYGVAAGERFRLTSGPAVRVSVTRFDEEEAPRLAAAIAGALRPTARTYSA